MLRKHNFSQTKRRKKVDFARTPLEFLICCRVSKRFYLQWKALDFFNKMRYILWVVALLEACDVTNNNDRHLGFYQELEIRLK